jgi:hypothetical protein
MSDVFAVTHANDFDDQEIVVDYAEQVTGCTEYKDLMCQQTRGHVDQEELTTRLSGRTMSPAWNSLKGSYSGQQGDLSRQSAADSGPGGTEQPSVSTEAPKAQQRRIGIGTIPTGRAYLMHVRSFVVCLSNWHLLQCKLKQTDYLRAWELYRESKALSQNNSP